MASGFSWGGGRSRCFSYWQEFQKCYAQTDTPSECVLQAEDYVECLHHTKQKQRNEAVQAEYQRKVEHYAKEQHNNAAHATSGGGTPEAPAK